MCVCMCKISCRCRVHMCTNMYVYIYVPMSVEPRGQDQESFRCHDLFFSLETGSFTGLELAKWALLVGQQV